MIAEAIIKGAAVGGIAMLWGHLTLKAIKICQRIVFSPETPQFYRCEHCSNHFTSDLFSWSPGICKYCAKKEVVCEECQECSLDDGELLEQDKFCVKFVVRIKKNSFKNITMSDNKLVKTIMDAATLIGLAAGIGWASKKVLKEDLTANPSANIMNYIKFPGVMTAASCLNNISRTKKFFLIN